MTSQCCCCSDSCSSARSDKCHKQNSNPIDLYKRFSMDLEFNILGFGFTKRCSGINLPPFGTTLVYWESFYIKFLFMPQWRLLRNLARKQLLRKSPKKHYKSTKSTQQIFVPTMINLEQSRKYLKVASL